MKAIKLFALAIMLHPVYAFGWEGVLNPPPNGDPSPVENQCKPVAESWQGEGGEGSSSAPEIKDIRQHGCPLFPPGFGGFWYTVKHLVGIRTTHCESHTLDDGTVCRYDYHHVSHVMYVINPGEGVSQPYQQNIITYTCLLSEVRVSAVQTCDGVEHEQYLNQEWGIVNEYESHYGFVKSAKVKALQKLYESCSNACCPNASSGEEGIEFEKEWVVCANNDPENRQYWISQAKNKTSVIQTVDTSLDNVCAEYTQIKLPVTNLDVSNVCEQTGGYEIAADAPIHVTTIDGLESWLIPLTVQGYSYQIPL